MKIFLWWAKQVVIGGVSGFFLIIGIKVLIGSYSLDNPLEFIMYFFSSSMLILVSAAVLLYPIFRIYGRVSGKRVNRHVASEDKE